MLYKSFYTDLESMWTHINNTVSYDIMLCQLILRYMYVNQWAENTHKKHQQQKQQQNNPPPKTKTNPPPLPECFGLEWPDKIRSEVLVKLSFFIRDIILM